MISVVDADKGLEIIHSFWHKSDKAYTIAFPTKKFKNSICFAYKTVLLFPEKFFSSWTNVVSSSRLFVYDTSGWNRYGIYRYQLITKYEFFSNSGVTL